MKQVRKKGMVCKYGRMVIIMMVIIKIIKFMVKESFSLLMGICITVIGSIIRHTDKVNILNLMVINMKANLYKMYNKVTVKRLGLMVHNLLVIFIVESRTDGEPLNGWIKVSMKEIGKTIKWTGKAPINGLMEKNIMDSGKTEICTEKAYINGLTEEFTKVNILKI